jgi:HTH-type transcriptional regulator/antitoxin HigA
MKAAELAELLGLSKGALSNILNYRRRFTSTHIRILAARFRISQEALNRSYPLAAEASYPAPPPLATAAEDEPEPYEP